MSDSATPDRYVSFCGIECDTQANRLMERLKGHLDQMETTDKWYQYFHQKFDQQVKYSYDNLHFVGAQLNPLYTFFEEIEDEQAMDMLWKLEQECC